MKGGDPYIYLLPHSMWGFLLLSDPFGQFNQGMEYICAQTINTQDKKPETERRYRNILANSGKEMESGEVRDLDLLYVMGREGKLIKISTLDANPDEQTQKYKVNFAANHGHNDIATGERVVDIEDVIGDAKVWMEKDGLHARVYFANDDPKADHAYAISDNASYSIGTEWYPDGYYGADESIDGLVGILREISMVDTGNDPRAYTLDHKPTEAQAQGSAEEGDGENNTNENGEIEMAKTQDELTPDENRALKNVLSEVVDRFTTDVPEGETEPTARESKDDEGEAPAEAPAEEKKDVLRSPVVIIRDKAVKQETPANTSSYLKTDKAVAAWGQALIDSQGDARAWRENFRRIAKKDGVDFGENVSIAPEAVINAIAEQLNDEDTLFSHVNKTGLAFEIVAIPTSEDSAVGHVRGKTKIEENIQGTKRVLTPADIYKLMKLDHSMVKLNGGIGSSAIVRYVLRELPRKLIETIDKGILVGGIVTDDDESGASPFTALNPILTDIADGDTVYALEYTAVVGDNIRQTVSKAANRVTSSTDRSLVCTPDYFTNLENGTTAGGQLLFPNGIAKGDPRINGIRRIITPLWLTDEMLGDYEAVVVDLSNYHTVGDSAPESFTDYDIDVNKYVWEAVACIGGGLANKNAAVGIKANNES